jgi:FkbM family methyltransferase
MESEKILKRPMPTPAGRPGHSAHSAMAKPADGVPRAMPLRHAALELYYGAVRSGIPRSPRLLERTLEATTLRDLLQSTRADVILDVGANRGQFAGFARHVGFTGWIVSFEPQPDDYAALEASRRGDERWRGYRMALGEMDGEITLNLAYESDTSSILPSLSATRYRGTLRVPVRRLDELWTEVRRDLDLGADCSVFLKLDTQGYDLRVFAGASEMLGSVTAMVAELSSIPLYEGMPTMSESLRTFGAAEFRPVHFSPVVRDDGGVPLEFDCFMRRRQGAVTPIEL